MAPPAVEGVVRNRSSVKQTQTLTRAQLCWPLVSICQPAEVGGINVDCGEVIQCLVQSVAAKQTKNLV